MNRKTCWLVRHLIIICLISIPSLSKGFENGSGSRIEPADTSAYDLSNLDLETCIRLAMEKSRFRSASAYSVKAAEALHKQALSARWPQINFTMVYARMDEEPNFIFPAVEMPIPPLDLGGFNLDMPPIFVPEQDVKLMDEQTLLSSVGMMIPLFTGGLIPSFIRQAGYGVEIAKQESRRSEHQIIYDVKRYYYAAVMTKNLYDIGKDALDKLQATLDLSENMYKNGSGRVTKTDYLKNRIVVENVRSMVSGLKHTEFMAKAALIFSMGLHWNVHINLASEEIPYDPYGIELNTLVDEVYDFNPDWMRLEWAIKVFESKVKEAKSGYFPKIALIGGFTHLGNPYDFGMVTPQNKNMWTVGIGLDFNAFAGLRTKNRVKEAQYRLSGLKERRILLREGLALQVQKAFTDLISIYERHEILKEGLNAAVENRDLTERAYQNELMEEKDLIESQIFESIMKVQFQKVLYDHIEAQAHLEFLIGSEFLRHAEGM